MTIKHLLQYGFKKNPVLMRLYAAYQSILYDLKESHREKEAKEQFELFRELSKGHKPRFELSWKDRQLITVNKTETTHFDRHYVYHPAWASRVLAKTKPSEHVDISSTLHFIGIVSAFLPIKFYDYRPADLILSDLKSEHADLLDLPFEDGSVESLSCMHVLEHIGLGRYGEDLDPVGDIKAMKELKRVICKGGDLLIVTPIAGRPKLRFNGNRIYTKSQIIEYFSDMKLMEMTLIPESASDGGLVTDPSEDLLRKQSYGCGCFWFQNK